MNVRVFFSVVLDFGGVLDADVTSFTIKKFFPGRAYPTLTLTVHVHAQVEVDFSSRTGGTRIFIPECFHMQMFVDVFMLAPFGDELAAGFTKSVVFHEIEYFGALAIRTRNV